MNAKLLFISLAIFCLTGSFVMADVATFVENDIDVGGYQALAGAILESNPNNNYGTDKRIIVGATPTNSERGLFGYDISSIPANATIDGVTLKLSTTYKIQNVNGVGDAGNVLELYEITGEIQEGAGTTVSGSSWNSREIATDPDTAWTTAGGDVGTLLSSNTVDMSTFPASGVAFDYTTGPQIVFGSTADFVAAAQNALTGGTGTLNMLLKSATAEAATSKLEIVFCSDDPNGALYYDYGSAYYPTLTVTYHVEDPAIPGDANNDGYVDGSDATILAGYWQQTGATWAMGDFNGDGVVDGSDATILAGYWQQGTPPDPAAVPEPSTIVLLLAAFVGWFFVRRR